MSSTLQTRAALRTRAPRFVAGVVLVLLCAAPVAAFIRSSGILARSATTPTTATGQWHPAQPPISLAARWNVGWALNGRTPSDVETQTLLVTDALTPATGPKPTPPPAQLPALLGSMPTGGWTLDTGATITTDSNDVLVLRPLTNGRPSLPGQGSGWRGAYWLPLNTANWSSYVLQVKISNLGAEGSGGSATVVVGHTATRVGYAVSISAARITIQSQTGRKLFTGVISGATAHQVSITLTTRLKVVVDGSPVATFATGRVHGGIGFGVYKPDVKSNLPFFSKLVVRPA